MPPPVSDGDLHDMEDCQNLIGFEDADHPEEPLIVRERVQFNLENLEADENMSTAVNVTVIPAKRAFSDKLNMPTILNA